MKRLLLVLLALLCLNALTAAQTTNVVQPEFIYVRSGPGERFVAIGALFRNDAVEPLNRSDDGVWILVRYGRGTGWIAQKEVQWQTPLETLPILAANVTPTAATPTALPSQAPSAEPLAGFVLLSGAEVAFVRAGPGRGYMRLGQLAPGMAVDPVARNNDASWVMIRFTDAAALFEGFGWVARNLVQWRDDALVSALPIIDEANLTPTPTFTPSATLSVSATPEGFGIQPTPVPTDTPTLTSPPPTAVPTLIPSLTATWTPEPTATETASLTMLPPTATFTAEPSSTETLPATQPPASPIPPTAAPVIAVSPLVASATTAPSVTPTPLPPTVTPTQAVVAVAASPTAAALLPTAVLPTPVSAGGEASTPAAAPGFPVGALAFGAALLLALGYMLAFLQGAASARRYDSGFVVATCPVCQRGKLTIEARSQRVLGIPGAKRTVRCDVCRSVLREKRAKRWVYAVDRIENPRLYDQYNGREITDAELKALSA